MYGDGADAGGGGRYICAAGCDCGCALMLVEGKPLVDVLVPDVVAVGDSAVGLWFEDVFFLARLAPGAGDDAAVGLFGASLAPAPAEVGG